MNKTYTRQNLAKLLNINSKAVCEFFNGKTKYIPRKHRKAIADYLEITEDQLVELIKKAQTIEKRLNPYRLERYRSGMFKRVSWSKGDKLSLTMFDDIYNNLPTKEEVDELHKHEREAYEKSL